jgi:xanthine/CO dehydrogenase XdhC/CoxF family maturation factor
MNSITPFDLRFAVSAERSPIHEFVAQNWPALRNAASLLGGPRAAQEADRLFDDLATHATIGIHDWEPPILIEALKTPAFYIGAQGSQRARDTRFAALRKMHVTSDDLIRLRGPIGMIASARDPRTLAISVLAEVISEGTSAAL